MLTEGVLVVLIANVFTVLGILVKGIVDRRKDKDQAERDRDATKAALAEIVAVRTSLTTNNSGSHVKDWIDELRRDVTALRRAVDGINERMTSEGSARAAQEQICQTRLQSQIDGLKHAVYRDGK